MRNGFAVSETIISDRPQTRRYDHSDAALLDKITAGSRPAMQVLYARHQSRIYRFILRMIGNEAAAEDLTSEVFLSVWQQAGRFEARSTVATWLLGIARYKALSELRRRPELSFDETAALETADADENPEVALQSKHRAESLRACLMRLSRDHREIIDLVYYHAKSVEEVVQIVGIPAGTVKTRMFHARRRLSELLAARGIDGMSS
jgi:RNA polymerase sigma-70 factor (ECF subfamily)